VNRLTRITAILIQLQSKRIVTAKENENLISIFNTIEQKGMVFPHFEIFNSIEN